MPTQLDPPGEPLTSSADTGTELRPGLSGHTTYHIRLKGHLHTRWSEWFDYLTITPEENGDTLLTGPIVDQAALHSILTRIRDLGLPLVSVMEIDTASTDKTDTPSHKETTP